MPPLLLRFLCPRLLPPPLMFLPNFLFHFSFASVIEIHKKENLKRFISTKIVAHGSHARTDAASTESGTPIGPPIHPIRQNAYGYSFWFVE